MSTDRLPVPPDGNTEQDLHAALNQIFAEYALLYPGQFRKAFPSEGHIQAVKKLWHSYVYGYDAANLLKAAHQAVVYSKYLPSVHEVLELYARQMGIPDTEQAFDEAYSAFPPLEKQRWSHPVVYFSLRRCGAALMESSRHIAWPIFCNHYRDLCQKALRGTVFQIPKVLPAPPEQILPPEQGAKELALLLQKLSHQSH